MKFDFSTNDLKDAMYDYLVKLGHINSAVATKADHILHVYAPPLTSANPRLTFWLEKKPADTTGTGTAT